MKYKTKHFKRPVTFWDLYKLNLELEQDYMLCYCCTSKFSYPLVNGELSVVSFFGRRYETGNRLIVFANNFKNASDEQLDNMFEIYK